MPRLPARRASPRSRPALLPDQHLGTVITHGPLVHAFFDFFVFRQSGIRDRGVRGTVLSAQRNSANLTLAALVAIRTVSELFVGDALVDLKASETALAFTG